jgi:hypothetical protein
VRVGLITGIALSLAAADSCPGDPTNHIVDVILEEFQNEINDELGFTVHVVLPPLERGASIVADAPEGPSPGQPKLECKGKCILAMLDLQPRAHFAHPVILGVYDFGDGEVKTMKAEWWPLDETTGVRYFDTVGARRKTLICREGFDCLRFYPPDPPAWNVKIASHIHSPLNMPSPTKPNRSVWAVVVNGYDDPGDTFDEDTNGIYRVLRGLGVDEDHICYLTDEDTDGADDDARPWTVQNALKYVAYRTSGDIPQGETDATLRKYGDASCGVSPTTIVTPEPATDFMFFYSSHGNLSKDGKVAKLICNHKKVELPKSGYIHSDELVVWLDPIKASRVTVVIEACKSGGFLEPLKMLPQDNVSLFLSSGKTQSSFMDVDPDTDTNPGDAGSETIWGFIEAFGTSGADTDAGHGEVSFDEAVTYAQDHDASNPAVHDSIEWQKVLNPPVGPYLGLGNQKPTNLKISKGPQTLSTTTSGGSPLSLLQRNGSNTIILTIQDTMNSDASTSTVLLHIEQQGETEVKDWDHAPTMILPGLASNETVELKIKLEGSKTWNKDEFVTIVATVDSPLAPFGSNLQDQEKKSQAQVTVSSCPIIPGGCVTTRGGL